MSEQPPDQNPSVPSAENPADQTQSVSESQSAEANEFITSQISKIEKQLAHIWMVRNFLKHCDEAEDDEDVCEVQRQLYDYIHAVGVHIEQKNFPEAVRFAKKKLTRLKNATALFEEIQEEVSTHTNFRMANRSLRAAVNELVIIVQVKQ